MTTGTERAWESVATRALLILSVAAGCGEAPPEASCAADVEVRQYVPPAYPDAQLQDYLGQPAPGPSPYFTAGVVATSAPLAAVEGREVLASGGDALDAAVVVQAMLAVVEPQGSGLGGGGLWLIYLADSSQTLVIDCRERAPAAATPDMLASKVSPEVKSTSGIAVGVPGTLHCMRTALSLRPGGLTLAEALQPAIAVATKGFHVDQRLAKDSDSPRLKVEKGDPAYDEARKVFRPGGKPLLPGAKLKQPALAATMKQVQLHGLPAFYDCAHPAGIADAIIAAQKATRDTYPQGAGRMTCADLEGDKAVITEPVTGTYRGYTIVSTPPPSSGISLLHMLGVLEHFELGAGYYEFGDFLAMNVMQETMRLAFADRSRWLGDPDHVKVPVTGILSPIYIEQRRSLIVPGERQDDIDPGDPRLYDGGGPVVGELAQDVPAWAPEGRDTTHFVIADGSGNIVSVTTTIGDKWGVGLMAPDRGFLLNEQMLNFNEEPELSAVPFDPGANDIAPHKRPRTALAPALVFRDGRPLAALGSPGGGALLNSVLQFIIDLIDHRMTLQQAVAAPRFSLDSSNSPWETEIEPGFAPKVRAKLIDLGYDLETVSDIGDVQAVIINQPDGRQYGTADPRRGGAVEGLP
jgi:gamma-glutamyltranspeptidase/glutathione hydrolase